MESPSAKRRDLTGSRSRWVCFIWNISCHSSVISSFFLDWLVDWDLGLETESTREELGQEEEKQGIEEQDKGKKLIDVSVFDRVANCYCVLL